MLVILALVLAQQPPPEPLNLHLVCHGVGDHAVYHTGIGSLFSRHGSATVLSTTAQQDQFGEQMDVEIADSIAKVRVPRRFLPPAHGGKDGWFRVSDLRITPDTIAGKVYISFASHPNFRVDRRVGTVAMDGSVGSYAGKCEAYDPDKAVHAF